LKNTKYRTSQSTDKYHIDNRRLNRCFVDFNQKLIYVYTHKNASESIRRIIPVFLDNHIEYESIKHPQAFLKFWVIRNPLDRIVSSFQEMRKLRDDGPFYVTEKSKWFNCSDILESFEFFLEQIKENYYDPHCFPQVISLYDKKLTTEDVTVICLDYMNAELLLFFQKHNITHNPLPDIHHSNKEIKQKLKSFINETPRIWKKIIDLYPEDYEIYNQERRSRQVGKTRWHARYKSEGESQGVIGNQQDIVGRIRPNIHKLISGKRYAIKQIDPQDLLTPQRFDIVAKLIYAQHRLLGIKSNWAERLYVNHLKVFNGFFEPDGTGKIGIDAFKESFYQILRTVKEHGFDDTKSLIPVGRDNIILDGSHKIAACLLYDKKVTGLLCDAQAFEYDYRFFRHYTRHVSSGLAAKWADAMAFEYCRLKDNTFVATVFPSAIGKEDQLQRILEGHGKIVYAKDVHLFNQGPFLLMRQMYKGEEWLGSWSNNFAGAQQKAGLCFQGNGPMKVFILETDGPLSLSEAKNEIRDLYKIGNHSIHINDTHEETIRLAQILLNDNSIDFLNRAMPCYYQIFDALFEYFKDWLKRSELDNEYFCVDGSSVMAVYGIRSARDLDFLHFGHPDLSTGHPLVSSHDSEIDHYTTTRDDIIFNPENHFYYDGVKFASLEIIRAMKEKRGEAKDIRDVKIIDSLGGSPKPVRWNAGKNAAHDPGMPERADYMPNPKVINYVYAHTQAAGFSMHKGDTTVIWSNLPIENCDVYAYQDAFSYYGDRRGMNVLMMHEPVVVLPGQYSDAVWDKFDYVFTSLDSLAEKGGKFRKFNHPAFDTPLSNTKTKAVDLGYQQPLDQKEDAICMISGNKFSNVPGELYSKRVEIAKRFKDFSDIPFDVYGRPPFWELPNYKGELNPYTRKFEVLAKYRYSLCFENVYHPEWSRGYLTEKLLHCLMCGTVPVYLGCYNIEKYVTPECFIDFRQFKNLAEFESFIRSISNDTYNTYIRNIQNWVNKRNLNQYSIHRSYDKLLCLLDRNLSEADLSQQHWLPGPAPEHFNSEWRVIKSPAVWSWADLANAASKEIVLDNQPPETQECVSQERHKGQRQESNSNSKTSTKHDKKWAYGEWLMKSVPNPYGLIEINGVKGFMGQGDVRHLYEKAKALPQNCTILEVGSFMGLSAIIMGCGLRDSGNNDARIYCVDPWDNKYLEKVEVSDSRELYDIFKENITRAGLESFIYPLRMRSTDAADDFADHSVDLVFIDGDHSYESCYADLASWYSKIRPGGTIIGHDCRPGKGVHRAVEKFTKEFGEDYFLMRPPETSYMFEVKKRDTLESSPVNKISDNKLYNITTKDKNKHLTSIIILNFNGADHIKKCIESIRAHTPESYELIVVDNASTDDSLEFLRVQPDITLVENTTNLGCPPARTQAMAMADGEYVLLLDNDTVVTPGWLTTLLGHARQNPNIGLIGPRSNFVSGQQLVPQVSYKGIQELNEFAGTFCQQNKGRLTSTTRLVGFCMLIRRAVIDKVGAPDPQFGKFGFEDDDYTWRAIIAGFRAAIAHDVFIHHTGGPQLRGNVEYNNHLREAWNVLKRKWDLPPDLEYGAPFNISEILSRPFSSSMHYVPVPDRSEVEPLIYHPDRGRFKTILADTTERVTGALSASDWFEAIDLLKAAIEEAEGGSCACYAEDISSLWNSLGYSYFSAGNISKAEESFLKGLESLPNNIDPLNNLADLYRQQGQYSKAIEYLERALAVNPGDMNVLLSLGNCSLELGAVDAALVAYRRVLALAPDTAGVNEVVNRLKLAIADASNISG